MKIISAFLLSIVLLIANIFLVHQVSAVTDLPSSFTENYSPVNADYPSKEIVVSLSQETLSAYDGNTLYLRTPITAGGPDTSTPLGSYRVIAKYRNFVMHSPWPTTDWRWYPDSFINYGLLFKNGGYFIHDASWRDNFGYGSNIQVGAPGGSYTGSHGCVNVPLRAEAALYKWASVGTTVIIQE